MFHRVHLSSTNLLTSEKRNQLKSEWCLIDWECWTIDWHEIKPDKCFKIRIFLLITIWLFGFSGVSFHSTELALNSSENVRGNYLSNDNIYDHMNLQLTFGGQGVWPCKVWKGKQRINCKWRIRLQRDKWSIWLNDFLLFTIHV